MQKDDIIECDIESLAFGGAGVARVDGMAVFVQAALPGQRVQARVTRAKKRFAEAVAMQTLRPSPHQVQPVCPHYGECGGCAMQDLDYAEQLRQKARQVEDTLRRIGRVEPVMSEPVGSPHVFHYRNKMEFAFEGEELRLGLRKRLLPGQKGQGDVLDLEECHLCSEATMTALAAVRRACRESGLPAYDPRSGRGYWRHCIIRHTSLDQVMVHLITSDEARHHETAAELGDGLRLEIPSITSFVHSSRRSRRTLAFGERVEYTAGQGYVEECLNRGETEVRYRISPNSFFQTNTEGASALFGAVLEMGAFSGESAVLDLYCGAGGIGLFLAPGVRRVQGFELSEESVEDARVNARMNSFHNCEFHAGSLEGGLRGLEDMPRPDIIVCDPPRSGMHDEVVRAILRLGPDQVVAVSCDPSTLARDVNRLSDAYALVRARAVDMFPHTHHVETVALLQKRNS
ncbi:23S rRNA (uracil(1939)-C(5))-methyltransferase RlmD [Salidesulfovibrio onnuriiensis]|uniref:23S rRNA (uracil(1939)-C(5))-methyltransferase RlmD n=1 Tax=Salidesulfovibrio onnuriiensis TaxID=2583823 RepID=UPI0011C81C9A|nr:23S rRNA (uracil(1939)-C(5))-methyltransferase RlmD [Salidesulfovibrio onnuriiensis]